VVAEFPDESVVVTVIVTVAGGDRFRGRRDLRLRAPLGCAHTSSTRERCEKVDRGD
jgi:hypothetical protein